MPPKKKELRGPLYYIRMIYLYVRANFSKRTENRTNSTQKLKNSLIPNIPELHSLMLVTKASYGTVCMYSIRRERRRGAGGAGEKQGAVDKLRKAVRQQAIESLARYFEVEAALAKDPANSMLRREFKQLKDYYDFLKNDSERMLRHETLRLSRRALETKAPKPNTAKRGPRA